MLTSINGFWSTREAQDAGKIGVEIGVGGKNVLVIGFGNALKV